MIVTKVCSWHWPAPMYRASLAGYLDKYAPTRMEAIAYMLKQVTYWNNVKNS